MKNAKYILILSLFLITSCSVGKSHYFYSYHSKYGKSKYSLKPKKSKKTYRSSSKRYYYVKKNETLSEIAKKFGVSVVALQSYNGIDDPTLLRYKQKIKIPSKNYKPKYRKASVANVQRASYRKLNFIWPVNGPVYSGYGYRKGKKHHGIDISVSSGTKIKAAASGKVMYSGKLRGYGNIVIVKHGKTGYTTVYAHNKKNLVKEGEYVKQGQLIAYVGQTGRTTGPHLHFEVRKGNKRPKSVNPKLYLKKRTMVAKK